MRAFVASSTDVTTSSAIPAAWRAEALRMNDQGWADQMKSIERHVAAGS